MTEITRILDYLDGCRSLVIDEIQSIVPTDSLRTGGLYALMLDYPLRGGKAIRPALCMSVCRAAGGTLGAVLPSAAVLELYHNAFLIHDDVEDRSDRRRSEATLNHTHGMPTAVNVGDGMLALAIRPLLDNMALIGLGKALKILQVIAQMARQTAEGQMIELQWIRSGRWASNDADYLRLVYKKTAWYSFMAPMVVGGIAAGLGDGETRTLGAMAIPLGIAFQIQDDILNLVSPESDYGKDYCADLWESKRTLLLIHALRCATDDERRQALDALAKPQPQESGEPRRDDGTALVAVPELRGILCDLVEQRQLSPDGRRRISEALRLDAREPQSYPKTAGDIDFLRSLIDRYGSIDYARAIARRHAMRFRRSLERLTARWPGSIHRDFLFDLHEFTIQRSF